ncbi:MAG: DUF389 domain-containing protein [Chloroflexi bacterium]|nr:DUF389 domain-containing protein [Chloroflexota bacterium]
MKQPERRFLTTHPSIGVGRALTLALPLTLALNALLLPGWLAVAAGEQAVSAYALFLVLGLVIVLTYAERALRVRPGDSLFALMGGSAGGLGGFAASWILLLGNLALIILLGWSAALYARAALRLLFTLAIPPAALASLAIFLIGLRMPFGAKDDWSVRAIVTYAAAGIMLITLIGAGFQGGWSRATGAEPSLDLFASVALLMTSLWSIAFALDARQTMRRATRVLPTILTIPLLAGGILGLLALLANAFFPLRMEGGRVFLVATASSPLPLLVILAGIAVSLLALDRALWSGHRLLTDMIRSGFLPASASANDRNATPRAERWLPLTLFLALVAAFAPLPLTAGLAGLAILWYTGLLFLFEIRSARRGRRRISFQLPFHPLFPGLSAAIGFLVGLAAPRSALGVMLAWLLLGAFFYLLYVRRHVVIARQDRAIFYEADLDDISGIGDEVMMVYIDNPRVATNLIRAGHALARARRARLIALSVITVSEQTPEKLRHLQATEQLKSLEEIITRARLPETAVVEPLVRTASDIQEGVLQAAREMDVDLLILGWEDSRRARAMDQLYDRILDSGEKGETTTESASEPDLPNILNVIAESAPCSVAILKGRFPRAVQRLLLVTYGEDDPAPALDLAMILLPEKEGEIRLLQVLEEGQEAAKLATTDARVSVETITPDAAQERIRAQTHQSDLLILSHAKLGILEAGVFTGTLANIAREQRGPALLFSPYQGAPRLWVREVWRSFTEVFPSLTPREHEAVEQEMREAARPSINFFVLISLAAGIAILGLLQNSAAVIIGAMLVAPLMSPIVAMAMGVVKGDAALLREAAEAASKGIALAILVGILITLIAPRGPVTNEIMNRTQPTLLDLAVALLSGAAAGYALSRKEVSAALPGVSIAVALVPPLCVVGYGIASAHFEIAGGAFLLFLTNLVAITLAATVVFLTLGFRPATAREQQRFQRAMTIAFVALFIIAIPLAILLNASIKRTSQAARETAARQTVESIMAETLDATQAQVSELIVRVEDDAIIVDATIYDFAGAAEEQLDVIEKRLSAELEAPAHLRATLLSARRVGD